MRNPFGRLFSSIRDNSEAIMRVQLRQAEDRFLKLASDGRHDDALALAAEYSEWLEEDDEWGFIYLNDLSEFARD